jgi:hypothetical protein
MGTVITHCVAIHRAKARLAGMVQSRIKSLGKQENLEELSKIDNLDFSFSGLDFHVSKMLSVYNLSFGYTKDFPLIKELNLNTEQLIIASIEGNVAVISEMSKLA